MKYNSSLVQIRKWYQFTANHKDPGIPSSDEVFLQRWTESVSDEDFAEINLKMWQNTLGNGTFSVYYISGEKRLVFAKDRKKLQKHN